MAHNEWFSLRGQLAGKQWDTKTDVAAVDERVGECKVKKDPKLLTRDLVQCQELAWSGKSHTRTRAQTREANKTLI